MNTPLYILFCSFSQLLPAFPVFACISLSSPRFFLPYSKVHTNDTVHFRMMFAVSKPQCDCDNRMKGGIRDASPFSPRVKAAIEGA
jgi:hypothetical protein